MTKHKMGMWLCSNCNISVLSGDAHFCNYNMGERKMKQFDPSKPYQTRSGLTVGELHKYKTKYNDIVLEKFYSTIYFDTDHEVIHTWLLDGKSDSDHRNSEYDLVNTPEKEEAEMTDECKQYREGDDTLSCSCHINPPCSTCVDMLKENICKLLLNKFRSFQLQTSC